MDGYCSGSDSGWTEYLVSFTADDDFCDDGDSIVSDASNGPCRHLDAACMSDLSGYEQEEGSGGEEEDEDEVNVGICSAGRCSHREGIRDAGALAVTEDAAGSVPDVDSAGKHGWWSGEGYGQRDVGQGPLAWSSHSWVSGLPADQKEEAPPPVVALPQY